MIEIPLTQGKVALIDEEDLGLVSPYKWCAAKQNNWRNGEHFVAVTSIPHPDKPGKQKQIIMHRFITAAPKGVKVDHENHNTLDNRRSTNLRFASDAQNQQNQEPRGGRSIYKGVHASGSVKKPWSARIKALGRYLYLGSFSLEVEAALAYNVAAVKHYGAFAYLNAV